MDDPDEQVPDVDLIERLREGDRDATVELWTRHYPAVLIAARRVTRQPRDAEEIASDAFSGMLSAVASGAGPTTSVRAYLMTSVRNLAASRGRRSSSTEVITDDVAVFDRPSHDTTAHMTELELVRVAFAALPRRWQIVLWRTAVDRDTNIEVGHAMDLSPNAVAALAKRARKGFRLSYLRAHLSDRGVSAECEPFIDGLADLTVSETASSPSLRDHVTTCAKCTGRLAELRHVDRGFAGLLAPAVLGLVPTKVLAGAAGASAGAPLSMGLRPSQLVSHTGSKWALGAVGVVAATTLALTVAFSAGGETPAVAPVADPATSRPPSMTSTATPSVTPTPRTAVAVTASPSTTLRSPSPRPAPRSSRPAPTTPAPTLPPTPRPTPTVTTPPPSTPLTVTMSLRGPRSDTSIDVSAGAEGTTGPVRLTVTVPEGVAFVSAAGDWGSCRQTGGSIACVAEAPGSTTWAGSLHTSWEPDARGRVRVTVEGTYANGSPARGSVGTTWPP